MKKKIAKFVLDDFLVHINLDPVSASFRYDAKVEKNTLRILRAESGETFFQIAIITLAEPIPEPNLPALVEAAIKHQTGNHRMILAFWEVFEKKVSGIFAVSEDLEKKTYRYCATYFPFARKGILEGPCVTVTSGISIIATGVMIDSLRVKKLI